MNATTSDTRPDVWVGHAGPICVPDLDDGIEFYSILGLHLIHRNDELAALQLRGGTHLVLLHGPGVSGEATFDLMVDDIDGYRAALIDAGLEPATVEQLDQLCAEAPQLGPAGRVRTFAVSEKIVGQHLEAWRQRRHKPLPHGPVQAHAVDEDHRRSPAT